jgi:hypothetical protein
MFLGHVWLVKDGMQVGQLQSNQGFRRNACSC